MNRADNVTWLQIFSDLMKHGKELAPRGLRIREIENYQVRFNPLMAFCGLDRRNLSLKYFVAEMAWYFTGDPDDRRIEHYSGLWEKIANDSSPRWNSNYGQYFLQEGQLHYVLSTLSADKDSRQAVVVLNRPNVMMGTSKDKICTNTVSFRIRQDRLNMTVHMRSNDAVYGLGYDAPAFGLFYEMLLVKLREKYPDLQVGEYAHCADSFHIYEKHFNMAYDIMDRPEGVDVILPEIASSANADNLMDTLPWVETKLRLRPQHFMFTSTNPIVETLKGWLTDEDHSNIAAIRRAMLRAS